MSQSIKTSMFEITLKAQLTQGIAYFDFFNSFNSKQKLQQALKSRSTIPIVFFGKGWEKPGTIVTNPCNNLKRSMYQF